MYSHGRVPLALTPTMQNAVRPALRNHENVLPEDVRTVAVPITIGEGLVAAFGYPLPSVLYYSSSFAMVRRSDLTDAS